MSISRRNRRLAIYAYSSTTVEGVATDVWTLLGIAWGRVDAVRARQAVMGGATETQITAVAEFADTVSVPANAIIVDGRAMGSPGPSVDPAAATHAYFVRGVRMRRDQRTQWVDVEQVDRNRTDAAALYLDGTYALDGSQALSGVANATPAPASSTAP
jgi:hypothetical protein